MLCTGLLISFSVVNARDTLINFDFENVLKRGYDEGILDKKLTFKLFGQSHKTIVKTFTEYKTNKKTNGFGKTDIESCEWVMLGALKALQAKANSIGANAIIDIKSNYKNIEYVSSTDYQCATGFLMSGVALKAKLVSLK